MTNQRDFDDLLREWADHGDEHLPDRYLQAALLEVDSTNQRGAWSASLEGLLMRIQPFAVPLGIAVALVLAIGAFALVSRPPSIGPDPSSSPSPDPRHVTDEFRVRLSLSLAAGFEVRETDAVLSVFDASQGNAAVDRVIIGDARDVVVLGPDGEEPYPQDIAARMSDQEGVSATATDVTVGGLPGRVIHATITGSSDRQLLRIGPTDPGASALVMLPAGEHVVRLWELEVGAGRRVVVVVHRTAAGFDGWLSRVQPMIDSLRLETPTTSGVNGDYTTSSFAVPLTMSLPSAPNPDGWLVAEGRSLVSVAADASGFDRLVILDPAQARVVDEDGQAGGLPDDLVAWLNDQPGVDAEVLQAFDREGPATYQVDGQAAPVHAVVVDPAQAGPRTLLETADGPALSVPQAATTWWLLTLESSRGDLLMIVTSEREGSAGFAGSFITMVESIELR